MSDEENESMIMKALNWAYEKALEPGLPGLDSAYELADDYMKESGTWESKVNSLIRWQNTKSKCRGG